MKINIALFGMAAFMQSSCEVKQSLSASHVQIGLPKNSTVWKASLLHFQMEIVFLGWWYLFLDIIHLGHDGLIIVSSAYRWEKGAVLEVAKGQV